VNISEPPNSCAGSSPATGTNSTNGLRNPVFLGIISRLEGLGHISPAQLIQ
jgi:hypothetical protein